MKKQRRSNGTKVAQVNGVKVLFRRAFDPYGEQRRGWQWFIPESRQRRMISSVNWSFASGWQRKLYEARVVSTTVLKIDPKQLIKLERLLATGPSPS